MDMSLSPVCADAALGWAPGHVLPPWGWPWASEKSLLGRGRVEKSLFCRWCQVIPEVEHKDNCKGMEFPFLPPRKLVCAGNSGWGHWGGGWVWVGGVSTSSRLWIVELQSAVRGWRMGPSITAGTSAVMELG